ncbi:MAG: extracellular solute-binding protein family 1, partial [Paenibacillaceae bacterium]|nr:extracellular solute-binding protein family 1 [Paenibacillaceae bacterium]
MFRKSRALMVSVVCMATVLSACGAGANSGNGTSPANEPPAVPQQTAKPAANAEQVSLKVYSHQSGISEEQFNTYKDAVKKKFPNIDLVWIPQTKGVEIEDMLVSGDIPDIIATGVNGIPRLLDSSIPLDLRDQIKKHNFNQKASYVPAAIQTVEAYGAKGEIYALPHGINYFATTYNKDIFDKFGVSYPKNGMTWDEAIDLAKKLTRNENGTQYRGLLAGINLELLGWGLGLAKVDPKTNKATLNTDGWLLALNTFKSVYSIPGNEKMEGGAASLTTGTVAMNANFGAAQMTNNMKAVESGKALNWDATTYPVFKQSPGTPITTQIYLVVSTSKHPSEAFDVISYLSTDPTIQ